ncbi:hypothetical protein IFM89_025427 [Coptis chinensis]|uniref:Uncharacterized protein n=1 Tax=Coptis chinensis TaxID=261450 RepID=A0A835I6J4_9MAGN|nr:hypothetical protein IFM89_025427 [Coptis chinensis]
MPVTVNGPEASRVQQRINAVTRREFEVDRGNNTVTYDGNGPGAGTSSVRDVNGVLILDNIAVSDQTNENEHSEGTYTDDVQLDTEDEEQNDDHQVVVYSRNNASETTGSRFEILNELDLLESRNEIVLFQEQPTLVDPI